MKQFWLSSVAAIALISAAGNALAADMSRPPPPIMPAPMMPVYSWTGFYIGANLGGAWASGTLSDNVTGGSVSGSHSGFIGGGQLGYNWQFGNFVLGGEWLFDGTDLNAAGTAGNFSASAHTDWLSTATARFGWCLGPELGNGDLHQSGDRHRHPGERIAHEQRMDGRDRCRMGLYAELDR
jgi:outer membrane immunogenic protein